MVKAYIGEGKVQGEEPVGVYIESVVVVVDVVGMEFHPWRIVNTENSRVYGVRTTGTLNKLQSWKLIIHGPPGSSHAIPRPKNKTKETTPYIPRWYPSDGSFWSLSATTCKEEPVYTDPSFFFLLSGASIHLRLRLCCEDLRVSVDTGHESKSDRSADGLCDLSLVDWS